MDIYITNLSSYVSIPHYISMFFTPQTENLRVPFRDGKWSKAFFEAVVREQGGVV